MKFESKFDIDDVVYIKTSTGVSKGQIKAIALDCTKQTRDSFCFAYLIWESDRENNAGHHTWAYESNLGLTFEEAYYKANKKFPWDILPDMQKKDMEVYIEKLRNADSGLIPPIY